MVVITQNPDPGSRIISPISIGVPPYQTGWKWTKNPKSAQRSKKISQKEVVQVWKLTNFDRQAALFNGAFVEAIT
jgi:hypothetical protein